MQLHLKLTVVDDKEGPKKREGNIGLVPADESNRSNKVVYRLRQPNRSEMENRPKNATLLGQSTDFDIKFSNLLLFFVVCVDLQPGKARCRFEGGRKEELLALL